jgi:hypothetical protein
MVSREGLSGPFSEVSRCIDVTLSLSVNPNVQEVIRQRSGLDRSPLSICGRVGSQAVSFKERSA